MYNLVIKAMKLNKEYPATHSMSTAWYIADEEGNVGIMDFDENGPVPWQTEETSVDELVFIHDENIQKNEYQTIALTDEQIDELLGEPHPIEEEKFWGNCIVQIHLGKEQQFLELAKNPDFNIEFCISKKRGIYKISAYDCIARSKKNGEYSILENSSLKKMINLGIFLQTYEGKCFWMDAEWEGDTLVYEKEFPSAPYYIFKQSYWTAELPECMNVPKCPVKLDQFPEKLRKRVLKVPVKFKETHHFQIAEWFPCAVTGLDIEKMEAVDGGEYALLPLTDGTRAYILTAMVLPDDFFQYCSEKEKYDCKDCNDHCHVCEDHCFTSKPTVLAVLNPFEEWDYSRQQKSDAINSHSVWLPFLPKIPMKLKNGPNSWSNDGWQHYISEKDIRKHINGHKLLELFQRNRKWLEDWVARFNPRVILISGAAETVMDTVYSIKNHHIEINGVSYPMYLMSEVETHREEIERLTAIPYQGKPIPHIISVEEMEKIKQGK